MWLEVVKAWGPLACGVGGVLALFRVAAAVRELSDQFRMWRLDFRALGERSAAAVEEGSGHLGSLSTWPPGTRVSEGSER